MAIYMLYKAGKAKTHIKGDVETKGEIDYTDWIMVNSLGWGASRNIRTATGSSKSREASHPGIGELQLTKRVDSSSPDLMKQSLESALDDVVTISMTTTGPKSQEFCRFDLDGVGVSYYSIECSGEGMPSEVVVLNFAKISFKYEVLDEDLKATDTTTGFDLTTMKPGASSAKGAMA